MENDDNETLQHITDPFIRLCPCDSAERAKAQTDTTTFTYQGELNQNGQPVNSSFNLDFALFDAAVGGNQLGSEIMFNSFPIVDGIFTVDLDFGSGIFSGDPRFLQVTVNGTALVPRQRVNSAPYAIQSDNTRGIFVDDNNNDGIGTETPGIAVRPTLRRPDELAKSCFLPPKTASDPKGMNG